MKHLTTTTSDTTTSSITQLQLLLTSGTTNTFPQ